MKGLIFLLVNLAVVLAIEFPNKTQTELKENSNRNISPRITGGKLARRDQFPYQVALKLAIIPKVLTKWCGGSLISKDRILTAAHCLIGKKFELLSNGSIYKYDDEYQWIWYLKAFVGGYDLKNEDEFQVIDVPANPNFIIHPQYNPRAIDNDIAVVKLPQSVTLNEHVQLIRLPSPNIGDLAGEKVIATGYGVINDTTREDSTILRYVKLTVLENKKCYGLETNKICTIGKGGKGICSGDSGGPLALEDEFGKVVVGIVSAGFPLCEQGYPSYYTRVSEYLNWITEKMN